jgi:hypothetical protein
MSATSPDATRIVIALDASPLGEVAIEIVQHVASAPPDLLGLFLEDQQLLEHAKAPLAREVALSGRDRPFDPDRLERQLRAEAEQARGRFELAAARAGMRHAFRIARGEIAGELLRAAASAEAVAVTLAPRHRWRGASLGALARARLPALLFARESWLTGSGILAALGPGTGLESLRIAGRLAESTRSPLRVLLAPGALGEETAIAGVEELRRRGIALRLLPPASRLTPETIAQSARNVRLVIVQSYGSDADERMLQLLLAKTSAALLLVRD